VVCANDRQDIARFTRSAGEMVNADNSATSAVFYGWRTKIRQPYFDKLIPTYRDSTSLVTIKEKKVTICHPLSKTVALAQRGS